ncbi:hypothetical protein D9615_006956 [Tricholomella constricta]|uniref:Reverse transcriptase domain-containing protein n=1 Tax=Tricholomella constricta TaxID=117010 RepID=A0A8H5H8R8_9AGAR|nr:hypothetical protein D9615_006956 [Tricholomella constricta]
MHIIISQAEDSPNAKGVAIILNKRTTKWREASTRDIVPGRALQIELPWREGAITKILAVYGPNTPSENAVFWATINNSYQTRNRTKPDILLGDLNMVEDSLDRFPPHEDHRPQTEALLDLKNCLRLLDGWRQTHPTTIDHTFRMGRTTTVSRIDRIYVTEKILKRSFNWKIEQTGISTDHKMVSMEFLDYRNVYLGKGRKQIPLFLLKNKNVMRDYKKTCLAFSDKFEASTANRTNGNNPQTEWKIFKDQTRAFFIRRAKTETSKLDRKIEECKSKIDITTNDTNSPRDELILTQAILEEELKQLESLRHTKTRDNLAAKCRIENETMSKHWIQMNKEKTPRDTIAALQIPQSNPPTYTRRSSEMAETARQYHHDLQQEGLAPNDNTERETAQILGNLKAKLTEAEHTKMGDITGKDEIRKAIKDLPNGKAPGMDGIPHELWKAMLDTHDRDVKNEERAFDIVGIMAALFNDIETEGMEENTDFSQGWMCPIYKKNDRTDISNYRPITVLNTDYKIFTRALTTRLSEVVPALIHPDQAGFMKGRRLEDQTELAKLMLDRCEADQDNGALICLDQEKAYDKINHDFLWASLKKFDFPENFITTVKSLYKHAETVVILNGEISSPYRVTRGVRQGDPLSCLLFNLAIESLAASLRNSSLTGYKIKGDAERLLTTLFADDTTVYLSEYDSFTDLENILNKWCRVSGAKFNLNKTTIIPMGSEEYRRNLVENRKMSATEEPIPEHIHIAADGVPVRILGAFIGNKIENANIWTPTLEKIQLALERWDKSHPTQNGRGTIITMEAGGRSQFKARVQGMPKPVEGKLDKMIRTFMWNSDSTPAVGTETMSLPITRGGKKVLDIKTRNQAIELTKLKSYLQLDENRPRWAKVADERYLSNATTSRRSRDDKALVTMFIQDWSSKLREGNMSLPPTLRSMLGAAKKTRPGFPPEGPL